MKPKTLKNWKKELDNIRFGSYFIPTCDYCNEKLFVDQKEVEVELFEPYEKEIESQVFARFNENTGKCEYIPNGETIKNTVTLSSDPSKDLFKFKCPNCGHIISLTRPQMKEFMSTWRGDNSKEFLLNDTEVEKAKEFIEKHKQCREGKNLGAIGGQFDYIFTQTSIGSACTIKCNICGQEENITDYNCW